MTQHPGWSRGRTLFVRLVIGTPVLMLLPLVGAAAGQQAPATAPRAPALDAALPRAAEPIYRAIAREFNPGRAMDVVNYMDRFWRLAGNAGFDLSEEHLRELLVQAGFRQRRPGPAAGSAGSAASKTAATSVLRESGLVWYEEFPSGGNGWEVGRADLSIVGAGPGGASEPVFSTKDRVAICINSFSTPPGGVTAPLVYVGRGTAPADYEAVNVGGAVVLADGSMRGVWQQAVRARGARGVISAAPPAPYTRPEETPEVFQWGGIPYDESLKSFGFTASRYVAEQLKAHLARGPVSVAVNIETRFHPAAGRSLVAEIPGRLHPDERLVLVAHVQEPGANDNASGCGTLLEMARVLQAGIAAGRLPAPGRTLTFIWGDEIRASREWLKADPARAAGVRYMFSLDMTGEDTSKTGGTFLVEKQPDPSAVWGRPSDPHTEWGRGQVKPETLRGSLLNDLHLAVCLRRARDTGWVVRTNPYEGGSDHAVFLASGVPALLDWHFPDRYYHTNLDRPGMTSPPEMANVGIAVGTTALLLASAGEADAAAVVDLLVRAAEGRLDLEIRQSKGIVAGAGDRGAAEATERQVFDAWKKWYAEAIESVLALPVTPAGTELQAKVERAAAQVRARVMSGQ
jgi:aminopeptidase YwaD